MLEEPSTNGMSRLVVSDGGLLLLPQHPTLPLQPDNHPLNRRLEILILNRLPIPPRAMQRRLVTHVGDVGSGESRREESELLRDVGRVAILVQRERTEMNHEDLTTTSYVWSIDSDVSIESSWSHQSWVENVRSVGSCENDDGFVGSESVHFDEQLVEGGFSFVVPTEGSSFPASLSDGVDLVDEDDAGSVLLGCGEEVSNSEGTDSDEHLDEFRTGDGEEGDSCFTCGGFGDEGLSGSGRSREDGSSRDLGSEGEEASGLFEELDELHDLLREARRERRGGRRSERRVSTRRRVAGSRASREKKGKGRES